MIEELLNTIKSSGYWRVIIRPTRHSEKLIPTIAECREIISNNKLDLRGWDYPHIDSSGIKSASDNSVHSYCDWPEGLMYEYWRFYQTGQFVHYFSMREDLRMNSSEKSKLKKEFNVDTDKFLDITSTIYSVTEIYKFASQLFLEIENVDGVEIIIELHDVYNRMLFFWNNFGRYLSMPYICDFPEGLLSVSRVFGREELSKNYEDLSLEAVVEIFNKFNWMNINKQSFKEDQKKLLERRI